MLKTTTKPSNGCELRVIPSEEFLMAPFFLLLLLGGYYKENDLHACMYVLKTDGATYLKKEKHADVLSSCHSFWKFF
jgi:hypothetical protein